MHIICTRALTFDFFFVSEGVKDKATLQPHIDELLKLKTKWQAITGSPYDPPKPGTHSEKTKKREKNQYTVFLYEKKYQGSDV